MNQATAIVLRREIQAPALGRAGGAGLGALDSDAYAALWELSDAGGPRPEYVIPAFSYESGLDPGADNGVGNYGINQASADMLSRYGIDPESYKSWGAGAQIRAVVKPMYLSLVGRYGPIQSGARAYQANFLPATLAWPKKLSTVLASRADDPEHWYRDNPGLDPNHTGAITIGTLADVIARQAGDPYVADAIARAYALRPGEKMRDPALGTDFSRGMTHGQAAAVGLGIIAVAGAAAWLLLDAPPVRLPRALRRLAFDNPAPRKRRLRRAGVS